MEDDQLYVKDPNGRFTGQYFIEVLNNRLYKKSPVRGLGGQEQLMPVPLTKIDSIGYYGLVCPVIDLTKENGRHFTDETQQKKICTPIVKCMICESQSGIALEWETNRKDQKGRKRIICLDCTFDDAEKKRAEKKRVEKSLQEDPCVDNSKN